MADLTINLPERCTVFVLLAMVGLFAAYRCLFYRPTIKQNGAPLPKPPNTLPLVGNGILFLQARHRLFSWFTKCERLFGYQTFQISVPSLPPGVVINDPKNLEYVFKNEGIFSKGDMFKRNTWDLFGAGIITSDGDLWKVQRKAGLAFLNTVNMHVLTDVALPKYVSQMVEELRRAQKTREVVDLQYIFHEITSLVMGKMAYNMEMHADDEFTVAFDHASGATAERFQNPLWFITEVFMGYKFRKSLAVVNSFGRKIVQSAMRDRNEEKFADGSKLEQASGTLIQSLLNSLNDEKMVADAALNYLSAGRDTVAQALTWTMMLLLKSENAVVMHKIRKEVENVLSQDPALGKGDSIDNTAMLFTASNMPWTMAVFYESLRLYPPIPFEIKQCEQATTLPDGTFLPEKSIVVWCPWAMNRSRITWGDDVDLFKPERWLVDWKLVSRSPTEFPVFNGGARTCLGKKMAEAVAVQVIATIALNFDFEPAYPTERVSKSSLTLPMEDGLPCYVNAVGGSDAAA